MNSRELVKLETPEVKKYLKPCPECKSADIGYNEAVRVANLATKTNITCGQIDEMGTST